MQLTDLFTDIADSIRSKSGSDDKIIATDFPEAIQNIPDNLTKPLDPKVVYKETRPQDWLPMPHPLENEIYILFFIPDGLSASIGFSVNCNGNYTVELGTIENDNFISKENFSVASGTVFLHEIFASDYENLTSDGFKQCMVKVSGNQISAWKASSVDGTTLNFNQNIMEISCALPDCTSFICGSASILRQYQSLRQLTYFSFYGSNNLSTIYFGYCNSLICVCELDTTTLKKSGFMFAGCVSLVAFPALTGNISDFRSTFMDCSSLKILPYINMEQAEEVAGMFRGCVSLLQIPDWFSIGKSNNIINLFRGCASLQDIKAKLDISNVSGMKYVFLGCTSLRNIPDIDTKNVTAMDSFVQECKSLINIPRLNTLSINSFADAFLDCSSLQKILFTPDVENWAGVDIDLSYANFSHQAIVDLFNSLPTITETKTITLRKNTAFSSLTDSELAIATNKNWTVSN